MVEEIRALVTDGARALPEHQRALYHGLVVGDDRFQAPEQQARFRAAGLTHLLAVSGQNVAFVLTVAAPLTGLAGRRSRVVVVGTLLVGFAVATRAEPSVLRATVTAGLAAVASSAGARQSGVRLLALAVVILLLVDPFLVYSVGFQLSVAASAGILVVDPGLRRRLPGPRWLVDPLSVTTAAQLGVLPLQVGYFGSAPLVALPANLAAGWAAGAVMIWGLSVGVVAGVVGGAVATALQLPARGLLWWLDTVAVWSARAPVPVVDGVAAPTVVAMVVLGWVLLRPSVAGRNRAASRVVRAAVRLALAVATVAVAGPLVPRAPDRPTELEGGGWWWPASDSTPSVLVVGADGDRRLVDTVVASRIIAVDVVVIEGGTGAGAALARSILAVTEPDAVVAPPLHRVIGARRTTTAIEVPTMAGPLQIEPDGTRLRIDVDDERPP